MWTRKIFLLLSIIITAEISGACVVPTCSPQLSLYEINGSMAPANYEASALDMLGTNTGALIAIGFSVTTGTPDGFVQLYSFQGTNLVLENTIAIPGYSVASVALLKDNNNYYLAVGAVAPVLFSGDVQNKVFNITNLAAPVELASVVRNNTVVTGVDWLPVAFVDGSGDTNYFLAISATASGVGAIRVDIWQLNVDLQTVTTNVTGDNLAGFSFSVDWLSTGGSFYLASSVRLGTGAPTSGIGVYNFSAFPALLSTPAQNVPVEASATDSGQVGWFSLGVDNYLASAYTFSGGTWLKVTQFTPPSTFSVTPTCGVQLPSGSTPKSTSNVLIGTDNYITVGLSGTSTSLQIYKYDPSAGGSYCLAYEGVFGNVRDAKWITINGKQYLGVSSKSQTGCLGNNFHILQLDYVPDQPVINSPANGALVCTASVTVTGVAAGAACGDLQLSIDGGAYSSVVSNLPESGAFSFNTPSLSDGSHTLSVKSVLSTGAESTPTSVTITVDTQAPSAPVINNASECITCGPNPYTITGTNAVPNNTVTIYNNGTLFATTTADGSGNWSYVTPVLGVGTYLFTATTMDDCNHESAPSNGLCIIISSSPQPPIINAPTGCQSFTGGVTVLSGTGPVSSPIYVYLNNVQIVTTATDAAGAWSTTITIPTTTGVYIISARALDDCNRLSASSNVVCLRVGMISALVQAIVNKYCPLLQQ